jgi:tRNA (adenine37-N6)-methyltransferase
MSPMTLRPVTFEPIGVVRSAYTETSQIPRGCGVEHHAEGVLEIRADLAEGLRDVEGFSHLYVLWVFDRVGPPVLTVTPPSDDRPHGVFATRAPVRPAPIGLTVVRLLRRDGNRLYVAGVDMLDDSPVLDIKPYLSSVAPDELRRGWLAEAEARRATPPDAAGA